VKACTDVGQQIAEVYLSGMMRDIGVNGRGQMKMHQGARRKARMRERTSRNVKQVDEVYFGKLIIKLLDEVLAGYRAEFARESGFARR
jgi:hypothetical protein